jgi:lipoprotein-releasing system ATP-binding protein
MIVAQNIHKSFGNVKVLKGVNLHVEAGKVVAIVGSSGAGKTTLLQLLGTLSRFDKGSIHINGTDIASLKDKQLSRFRNRNIGFIFQSHHLFPEFTALENVMIPLLIQQVNKSTAKEKALDILKYLHLSHRVEHKPFQLSGGEQQRVAIARALITNPSIILADEPTGNLDSRNTKEVFELIKDLQKEFNQTIVIVTHNIELAHSTDVVFTMKDGVILE